MFSVTDSYLGCQSSENLVLGPSQRKSDFSCCALSDRLANDCPPHLCFVYVWLSTTYRSWWKLWTLTFIDISRNLETIKTSQRVVRRCQLSVRPVPLVPEKRENQPFFWPLRFRHHICHIFYTSTFSKV